MSDNFRSATYYSKELKLEDFDWYPFVEKYDEKKHYNKKLFKATYDKHIGEATYYFQLMQTSFNNNWFVCAVEELSDDDMKALAFYCPCRICKNIKLPFRQRIFCEEFYPFCGYGCSACVGCLRSFSAHFYWVVKAREVKRQAIADRLAILSIDSDPYENELR